MDDKLRFDQLEEIIAELLRKVDRNITDVGHLREAVAAQQLLLVQMQNDINRSDERLTKLTRVVNKGFQEFAIANERNERLLQETAVILAKHELFHQEMRDFRHDTRQELSDLHQDVNNLRQDVTELRQDVAGIRTTLDKLVTLLTKP